MNATRVKKNVAGYVDEQGRFRPIRSPQYVGGRKATAKDRKKYSPAKAGDLGKAKQERALEAPWDTEIRLEREAAERKKRDQDRIMREVESEAFGTGETRSKGHTLLQFVRSAGGIRRTFRHGGKKGVGKYGKRSSWDSGEIDRLSFKETGRRGLTTDQPNRGRTMDKMFQAARESGYDVTSIDDMMERVEAEAAGHTPTYATHGSLSYNPKKMATKRVTKKNPAAAVAVSWVKRDSDNYEAYRTFDRRYLGDIQQSSDGRWWVQSSFLGISSRQDTLAAAKRLVAKVLKEKRNPAGIKKNGDPFAMFAHLTSGVLSAIQINEMTKARKKRTTRRKNPVATVKANPTATIRQRIAKLEAKRRSFRLTEKETVRLKDLTRQLAVSARKAVSKGRHAGVKMANPRKQVTVPAKGDFYLLTIGSGDDIMAVYLQDGDKDGFSKRFKTVAAAKSFATRNRLKLKSNPIKAVKATPAIRKALVLNPYQDRPPFGSRVPGRVLTRIIKRKNPSAKKQANPKIVRLPSGFKWEREPNLYTGGDNFNILDPGGLIVGWGTTKTAALKTFKTYSGKIRAGQNFSKARAKAIREGVKSLQFTVRNPKPKAPAKRKVTVLGQTVTVGTKMHEKLVAQKKHFDDLAKSETGLGRKNPSFGMTKVAWVRDPNIPPGKPARGKLRCPCGNAPWSKYGDGRDVRCKCGTVYNSTGWVQSIGPKSPSGVTVNPKKKVIANPTPKRKNPIRSKLYETFQGRKPERVSQTSASDHAPARVVQLGKLHEIKLVGQRPMKFNPSRVRLCAANGKMWITGTRVADPEPTQNPGHVHPVGEIDHVVYETWKPHHGDQPGQRYIHKLGEWSGNRPTFCVDNKGYPVIKGGSYTIEDRGIVD